MQITFPAPHLPQSGATGLDRIGLGWLSRSCTARAGRVTALSCTLGFTPTAHDGPATARRDGYAAKPTPAGSIPGFSRATGFMAPIQSGMFSGRERMSTNASCGSHM